MPRPPKYIVDTNILFSALYAPDSLAGKIIDLAIEQKIELFAPEEVKEELTRNLKNKLDYTETELILTLESLPINWLNKKLYTNFLKRAQQKISSKDAHILAAHYFTKLPILTGDKEFFKLPSIETSSLRDVINSLLQSTNED
ncbi:MAG: PIN domain-containing protein [Candidatus Helarchaeota archaeon]